eukprot:1174226-Rhodomonas_salina.2
MSVKACTQHECTECKRSYFHSCLLSARPASTAMIGMRDLRCAAPVRALLCPGRSCLSPPTSLRPPGSSLMYSRQCRGLPLLHC